MSYLLIVAGALMAGFSVACILLPNDAIDYGTAGIAVLSLGLTVAFKRSALEGLLPKLFSQISLFNRFYTFVNGVFDLTAVVFYVTVIVFFLFLTVQTLEKRRYN